MTTETTCGGYCCERFHFRNNDSPADLKAQAARSRDPETKQIAEMVIYLDYSTRDIEGGEGHPTHWYTCKNFDPVTRLCKIYETRPSMCRNYNSKPWQSCGLSCCKLSKPEWPEHTGSYNKKIYADDHPTSDPSISEEAPGPVPP